MIMNNFFGYPFLPRYCDKPPTLYSILNSIVNGDKEEEEYTKIKDLAKEGRNTIFNFDYPLTENITKEKFECMILNKFLMRRIGFDTVTAFRIQLDVKLNEIMPIYNKMFDALENWEIFNDGETTIRTGTNDKTTANEESSENTMNIESENSISNSMTTNTENSNTNTSDRRESNTPQSQLDNVRDGKYVTNYNYDTNTDNGESETNVNGTNEGSSSSSQNGTSNTSKTGTDNTSYRETITRTPVDKISILKEMQENIKSIYSLIFDELDSLFYQLV